MKKNKTAVIVISLFLVFFVVLVCYLKLSNYESREDYLFLYRNGIPEEPEDIELNTSTVFLGEENKSQFNIHPYIAYFNNTYYVIWSSGLEFEDSYGQVIRYSTSTDGYNWSDDKILAEVQDDKGYYIARGIFILDDTLYALAAYIESSPTWDNLRLCCFELVDEEWSESAVFNIENCMNNYPPREYQDTLYLTCRDQDWNISIASSRDDGVHFHIEKVLDSGDYNEPLLYFDYAGNMHMILRDESMTNYLYEIHSTDKGLTWSVPIRTNYSDATSKTYIGRLSNSIYYLINNPYQIRDPLCISFSFNGVVFDHLHVINASAPPFRFEGKPERGQGFQYPHALEHDDKLHIVYSRNKEDILVTEMEISTIQDIIYDTLN